ncbi:hypothetical protein PBC1_016 [Bacillus phage PBC1]|uniref:Uncharacterized protein n=1 Tax=Bacillus phage PBC1 TaxID=1161901 RepID=I1TLF0_9CAUD|nr:hypothetical protein PBC1_gp16 [Bacillus phage PBC1]AFE86252.1 hypothetical protein PBC1_016 [Bacillus phage PBC1]
MFSLTERNSDIYRWHGVDIELNLAFDNVLVFLKMFGDASIPMERRMKIALTMLVVDKDILKPISEHGKLLDFTFDMLRDKLNLRIRDEDKLPVKDNSDNENEEELDEPVPVYDWEEDAGYIYSSFLFDYGIDLIEQQGKLTWDRFIQLFHDLSEKSKMGQAMYYRTCPIPKKEKGSDNEERKRIIKMKKYYMLEKARPIIERNEYRAYLRNKNRKPPQKE